MLQVCALGSIEKTDREVHVSLFYARTLQELTLPTTGDLCRRTVLIWEIRTQLGGNKYNAHPVLRFIGCILQNTDSVTMRPKRGARN